MQEAVHFLTVRELADRLASGSITSVELTQMYLDRAEELDPPPFDLPSEPRTDHGGMLSTMVTIVREQALESAALADSELRAGRRRSILHGVPDGVKELRDTNGNRTGFAVELVQMMADDMGVKLKLLNYDWKGLNPAVTSGKADFLAADQKPKARRALGLNFPRPNTDA